MTQETITLPALSIRQPWAWLIAQGIKDVENRTWVTKYRGPLLIHASLKYDSDAAAFASEITDVPIPDKNHLVFGAVIGVCDLWEATREEAPNCSPWYVGPAGLWLKDARPLERPFYCRGRLSIFEINIQRRYLSNILDTDTKQTQTAKQVRDGRW